MLRATICCGHGVLRLVISHTRHGGMNCYGHWVLRLVTSYTRQAVRVVTGIGLCVLGYREGGAIRYGQWVLRLVISHTRQGVRVVAVSGFCVLRYHTRARGYDLLQALGSASCDITHETAGYDLLRA